MMKLTSWQELKKLVEPQFSKLFIKLRQFIKNHPRLGGGIVVFLFLVIALFLFCFISMAPSIPGSKETKVFEVRHGASLREIGKKLETEGIIRSRLIYEIYVRLKPQSRMPKSGRYLLGPGMSVDSIVKELRRGIPGQIKLTIPEGLTNKEVAELLERNNLVDKERFLKKLEDLAFVNEILGDLNVQHSVEGYLYPDTYHFTLDATEAQIIAVMLKRFKEIYNLHLKEVELDKLNEVVVMASIIEKEAQKPEERPIIAGVFYNRLERDYPLQSCATVQYALGVRKPRLLYSDLKVNSPYNTYLHKGMPPGPIANPGLASLKAAIAPAKVSYLYFVAKPDGSHVFSNTFEEHLKAQRQIDRE
ncbi:MAG TPA: endolytic transglycosylase MltG [Bacillota bacterium]|nr:endolytic transglycosylase MltG [Bacillota bacterium]HOL10657.1 endolytic transglycosylase MltG [Bacillota bacterium]HPO98060.1 endolytic transglycosylase MltG [Bacillota bacterium]